MRIRLLGPIGVTIGGVERPLKGAHQRALLARLTLANGTSITAEALIDDLWGDDPPKTARNSLQRFVSDLRSAFDDERERLIGEDGTYRLVLERDECDATEAAALAERGRAILADDALAAAELLARAQALFIGDSLGGIRDLPFAQLERSRLDEMRTSIIEDRIDADLSAGRHGDLVAELEHLVEANPFRERLWGQLMLALYRAGRQADALRTFGRLRDTLIDELGIDPSPELRQLESQILAQDETTAIRSHLDTALRGYELVAEIGHGPDALVHEARQPSTGRAVALKQYGPSVADDPDVVRHFEARLRAISSIEHPSVASPLDAWREPGSIVVVSRLFRGGSLADRDTSDQLDPDVCEALEGALAAVHRSGIVHGRLHGGNVMIDDDGRAYLSDLSLLSSDDTPDTEAARLGSLIGRMGGAHQHAVTNPYKGLRAFQSDDAGDFFGRDSVIDQLVAAVARDRFVAVVGPSGVGKSSVVRAGLMPAIERGAIEGSSEWFTTAMIPGDGPFAELAAALASVAVGDVDDLAGRLAGRDDGITLAADELLPGDGQLLLVVDQFEELFTLIPSEAVRRRFIDALVSTVSDPRSRVRVVVTMRADFFDRPLRYPELGDLVRAGTVPLGNLGATELLAAITRPADRSGLDFEPGLVDRLTADIADQPNALPLLQFTLTELAERHDGGLLTHATYEATGGIAGAVAARAEAAFTDLDPPTRDLMTHVFLRLITDAGGTGGDLRRRVLRSELAGLTSRVDVLDQGLEAFGARRLLTFDRDPTTREPTVEVAHEAMLQSWPRLQVWADEHRDVLTAQRRLNAGAAEWAAADHDDGFLLTGGRLAAVEEALSGSMAELTHDERSFLSRSQERRATERAAEAGRRQHELDLERRSSRRLRALAAVLTVAALVSAVLMTFAIRAGNEAARQRDEAEANASLATARGLASASAAELTRDPELALLLALEAAETVERSGDAVPPEILSALHSSLDRHRLLTTFAPARFARTVPGTGLVITAGPDDRSRVLDVETGEIVRELIGATADVTSLAVSADATRAALGAADGTIRTWDIASGFALTTMVGHSGEVDSLEFDPGGDRLLSGALDGTYRLWDVASGEELAAVNALPSGVGTSIGWSPDGTSIWGLAFDSAVHRFDPVDLSPGEGLDGIDSACAVSVGPGDTVVVGLRSGEVAQRGELSRDLFGHTAPACATHISDDGRTVISGSIDSTAWVVDEDGDALVLAGHGGEVVDVDLSADSTRGVTASVDGTARWWDTSSLGRGEVLVSQVSPVGSRLDVAFGRSGQVVAAAAALTVHEPGRSEPTASVPLSDVSQRRRAEVSPDRTRAATLDANSDVVVVDLPTGVVSHRLTPGVDTSTLIDVAFSPDGRSIAALDVVGTTTVWDLATSAVTAVHDTSNPAPDVVNHFSLVFAGDGRLLVGDGDGSVGAFDAESGVELSRWESLGTPIWELLVTDDTDDALVIGAASELGAHVWTLADGDTVVELPTTSDAAAIGIGGDGTTLAVGAADGSTVVWDLDTLTRVVTIGGEHAIGGVAVDDSGTLLATVDSDGELRVRLLDPTALVELARSRVTRDLSASECLRYVGSEGCA